MWVCGPQSSCRRGSRAVLWAENLGTHSTERDLLPEERGPSVAPAGSIGRAYTAHPGALARATARPALGSALQPVVGRLGD